MSYVFVWVSYGSAAVYRADAKDDILRIVKEMNDVSFSMGEEGYDLDSVSSMIDSKGVEYVRGRLDVDVQEVVQLSGDDRFDYGSGFVEVK